MKEISLNILDITENSVRAGAKTITVSVKADSAADSLTVSVTDDGCGMSEELLSSVRDPFTTTRKTRRVGLGIPLFQEAAEMTGGHLAISSVPGSGTTVTAVFGLSHIDRMPLGDLGATLSALMQCNPDRRWLCRYERDGKSFEFDTQEILTLLGEGASLAEPEIACWIKDYLTQHIEEIDGGNRI